MGAGFVWHRTSPSFSSQKLPLQPPPCCRPLGMDSQCSVSRGVIWETVWAERRMNPKAGKKYIETLQYLYQTCGWDLNRLQRTDNATKEPLTDFEMGTDKLKKKVMSHLHLTQPLGLSVLSELLQSLFSHLLFWPRLWVILLGPGSWSALNRLIAPLSSEEERKKRHFSILFVGNGVLRRSQNVLRLWAFSRSKPSHSCFLNLLSLSESNKMVLCFDTLLCLLLPF